MNEIFGVSLTTIAIVMLVLFGIVAVVVVALALRNRIMFKLGVRNIPKRPTQTALIVLGLMLSTVLITAAFSTGGAPVRHMPSYCASSRRMTTGSPHAI
jgi:putative ABC transport system permease protein